ncbi:short chain dehydrogenase [Penicillium cosmopolitanum]|uniref:Short chain dehydrogenase n=1 Tax=Penicillium cosmopolitanum TaxID=1131564 RepID=A0A9X0BF67_9EURO|nr:short chain dehydrogenase [Penicillium cosmopolitanum]KAJ5414875.1 short chain dehydrogenase [Penicillium cosmopolitanum]
MLSYFPGANQGIGLGLAHKFFEEGWEVFGSVRPQTINSPSLSDLRKVASKIFEIDYLDESLIARAAREYGDGPLDCLVNCAGVSQGPELWQEYDSQILTEWFRIMVVGPFLTTKYFESNLEKSEFGGKLVNISSPLGSISENYRGTKFGYKIAKAALNQETRTIAMDLKGRKSSISVMAIDPGAVPTSLSRWRGNITVEESSSGIYAVIDRVGVSETGGFWSWNGEEYPF